MARGWTDAEDDRLRAVWGTDTLARLSPAFGRSQACVRYRAKTLGLIAVAAAHTGAIKGRWSESEESELRARWHDTDLYELSQRLCRSYGAVGRRARKLGLRSRHGKTAQRFPIDGPR